MSKSTTIVTTTTALSDVATRLVDAAASGPLSKQNVLNTFARGIAGEKHDWGYMTGSKTPVIQKGIPSRRLDDLKTEPSRSTPTLVRARTDLLALEINATPAALYSAEMATYLQTQLSGDLLGVLEEFSTETENDDGVQCMFDPGAIFADDKGLSMRAKSLWGATPEDIERTARAYFASSASEDVNSLVNDVILNWDEDAYASSFKAFYFAHAVVITTEYPFTTLKELQAQDREASPAELVSGAIRIFIDEAQDPVGRLQTVARVEDFLNRLAQFLGGDDPIYSNIAVR
mgnify:CR=1 FL=1